MGRSKKCGIVLTLAATLGAIGTAIVWATKEPVQRIREPFRMGLRNNLKQIALALHNYADVHGTLPPPAVYSNDGKPLLSWRVLILPYVDQEALLREFHLDEPWDSPHNSLLLAKMPQIYRDHSANELAAPTTTTFRVFVGPGTAFEGQRGTSLKDFPDGLENTILVAETAEAVPWTKPAELAFAPEGSLPGLGSCYPGAFFVVMGDGTVGALKRTVPESQILAALTRNGKELARLPKFDFWPEAMELK